jgi:hypothetical protein
MNWNALNDVERLTIVESMPGGLDGFLKGWGWQQFAQAIEDKCREKNEVPEPTEAEFDVIADDMHLASAAGQRERALTEARHYALQYLDESPEVRIEEVVRVVVERYQRLTSTQPHK